MDKIFFNKMAFYGYHGVYEEENRLGQRFYVDLEMRLDLKPAAQTDHLNLTVDYGQVYEMVKHEVENSRVQLIETLAENIAQKLLANFPIKEILVRVTKPDPPIPGYYDSVGVEIIRSQG
ncbi:dihydroneopterin aldolase [Thermoflavimicrobium dichotomicum]|uniref:7,8-dihydroneopterin aldolase n=1 Tax=Thermoflavimicrobium dichotomicum TaxID=46223 RepID=A0A1I3QRS0_9BACL|nr:dihydroneopterin aldolase [Thermoflavimicrobium dichotomicum]SFJ36122.1 dihydroneopterin aldolase [Thermoflavimicrobium dichotomicum]